MKIILGILMLGVLVFVHEFGHFIVAKFFKVKVLKFSLGFGPKLVSRTWGETEYMVSAVPLGGYVQMLGEGQGEEGEDHANELSEEDQRRSFAHQTPLKRIAIVAAGPLMNLLLPFLVLPIVFLTGAVTPTYLYKPAFVQYVDSDKSAGTAGFVAGDRIVSIGDKPVHTWQEGNLALVASAGDTVSFAVDRNGSIVELVVHPENSGINGLEGLGLNPTQPAIIGRLFKDQPAYNAGIKPGDKILEISGVPINSWYDMVDLFKQGKGREEDILIERKGETLTFAVKPKPNDKGRYLIGVGPYVETELRKFPLVDSIREGRDQAYDLISLTVTFVQKLITGDVSLTNLGGPLMVIDLAGDAAQSGLASMLSMLAFISIQLGILNLLPVPVLDGGHLLFNVIELAARRPISMRIREQAQQVGLMLLLALMAFVIYLDIMRKFGEGG